MSARNSILLLLLGKMFLGLSLHAQMPDLGGVKVSIEGYQGPATVTATSIEKFRLRVDLDPKGERQQLSIHVHLPITGLSAWPVADVEVRDADGTPMLVQRSGIEWEKMLIPFPAGVTTCYVQAVVPPGGWRSAPSEKERLIQDKVSGSLLRIASWPAGRAAALSLRFDDSHPTHLSKVVPILREYGFRGTFMVNPGPAEPGSRRISEFHRLRSDWEAVAKQGDHELANHSAHHRGASNDQDMDAEIGMAARAIWSLTPGKSKLMALNLGGGTRWGTSHTLRYYLDKYHQFDASGGSLGMDDSYGGRVAAFRQMLERHIQRGLWCRVHYHYIGDGLSSSEANFRAALDIAREHQDKLWIAGMADIYKYQTERNSATLALIKSDAQNLSFKLACTTDSSLYDRPLTIELLPPPAWNPQKLTIHDARGVSIAATTGQTPSGEVVVRFELPPSEAVYMIGATP